MLLLQYNQQNYVLKQETYLHHPTSNILGNTRAQSQFTGISGVIKEGLSHLAIPSGWNWGGEVSPYYPVFTEIFITPNSGTAL